MKLELKTNFDIGQEVFYIAEDPTKAREKCEAVCSSCGTKHFHYSPIIYKVFKGTIEDIVLEGSGEYHNIFINKIHTLSYHLKEGWYAKDEHLFLSEEEAQKYINDPLRRIN